MDQKPLEYNKHSISTFGALVKENNDKNLTSSNIFRTFDIIYLQSLNKIQGGNEIFYLHSHRVITRRKIIEIKIPKEKIKHIEEMAARDKVTVAKNQ